MDSGDVVLFEAVVERLVVAEVEPEFLLAPERRLIPEVRATRNPNFCSRQERHGLIPTLPPSSFFFFITLEPGVE